MDIKTQITWLRCFDDDELDCRVAARCADTMEKLLAVYEASKWIDVNPDYAEHRKKLTAAIAAVQTI